MTAAAQDTASQSAKTAEPQAGEQPLDPKRPVMDIKVFAPFEVYYEGKGYSISAVNETGPFDILPHHHNFICILIPCELVIKGPFDDDKRIKISRALMHVKAEKVVVFIDV